MSAIPAGTVFHTYLGPIVAEHAQSFDLGPVTVVLEYRQATKASILAGFADDPEKYAAAAAATPDDLDDSGLSFHVIGRDQHEYLRFDCLRGAPHYHYNLRPTAAVAPVNVEVKYDHVSNGDPVDWTLSRLAGRLGPMLGAAGAADLAAALDPDAVAVAVSEIRAFLDSADGGFADALTAAREVVG